MAMNVKEITKRYRYNGVELPAPPGLTDAEVRDLHSVFYPELVSAEIVTEEPSNGVQEVTFRRTVGTKG
ncbi:PRTRC system protein C [Pseudoduganella sp. UC29_106]|uniref:PRTRC system protein C n=1 Tax=Pseudoduganella sp. UC29_106 TaxID=3374553 RepID=UPI0037575107